MGDAEDILYMMREWGYTYERALQGLENGEQADIWQEKSEHALDEYLSRIEEGCR